ncbi:hypothetical protein EYF80_033943 [Liparis tanakae]|uniref:Uncharacterized protein n=1 Tax=Liparis tanakae TaxID=230148 RepID=A0A4Z2GRW8_9TELE|nr:hypothetical protein EYF80_033943 [Liparis tanakae]
MPLFDGQQHMDGTLKKTLHQDRSVSQEYGLPPSPHPSVGMPAFGVKPTGAKKENNTSNTACAQQAASFRPDAAPTPKPRPHYGQNSQ